MDECTECGFEYDLTMAPTAGRSIVDGADELAAILTSTHQDLRGRRQPTAWSPLEYACHLRDVFLVQRERVLLARRVDRPSLEAMGRDERVEHDGYADQDPDRVARQLTEAAHLFENDLIRLSPDDWNRTLMYRYPGPEPTERSLEWVAVHTLHEVRHHLLDVRRQLE